MALSVELRQNLVVLFESRDVNLLLVDRGLPGGFVEIESMVNDGQRIESATYTTS